MRPLLLALALAGCAELGVVSDGTTVSLGKPSDGVLLKAKRIPNRGKGFVTRERWLERDNRYGTSELVELIVNATSRVQEHEKGPRLVVADLSHRGGGPVTTWHHSHQSGRDVDIVYYLRDAENKPFEADAMRELSPDGTAKDGSGIRLDVPRTWLLVKELLTAQEATVQYIFMYAPFAELLAEHATKLGEPEALIAKARKAMRQPGDSAPHHDHMHVRIYCSKADRAYGCQDIGPMDLLVEREAELAATRSTGF